MSTKTDLAKEIITEKLPKYSGFRKFYRGNTEITEIRIESPVHERLFERSRGTYITVEADCLRLPFADFSEEAVALAAEIRKLLPAGGKILAVGIGNAALTADSLGPQTAGLLPCGEHKGRLLASFSPGCAGTTGLSPALLVKAAVAAIKPAAVVLIDALAAKDISAVCKTVQISNTGLAPGSGAGSAESAITKAELGVPVIALGTPTVTRHPNKDGVLVSPGDIDIKIRRAAKLLSAALALAVWPELDFETVREMIS